MGKNANELSSLFSIWAHELADAYHTVKKVQTALDEQRPFMAPKAREHAGELSEYLDNLLSEIEYAEDSVEAIQVFHENES